MDAIAVILKVVTVAGVVGWMTLNFVVGYQLLVKGEG